MLFSATHPESRQPGEEPFLLFIRTPMSGCVRGYAHPPAPETLRRDRYAPPLGSSPAAVPPSSARLCSARGRRCAVGHPYRPAAAQAVIVSAQRTVVYRSLFLAIAPPSFSPPLTPLSHPPPGWSGSFWAIRPKTVERGGKVRRGASWLVIASPPCKAGPPYGPPLHQRRPPFCWRLCLPQAITRPIFFGGRPSV